MLFTSIEQIDPAWVVPLRDEGYADKDLLALANANQEASVIAEVPEVWINQLGGFTDQEAIEHWQEFGPPPALPDISQLPQGWVDFKRDEQGWEYEQIAWFASSLHRVPESTLNLIDAALIDGKSWSHALGLFVDEQMILDYDTGEDGKIRFAFDERQDSALEVRVATCLNWLTNNAQGHWVLDSEEARGDDRAVFLRFTDTGDYLKAKQLMAVKP